MAALWLTWRIVSASVRVLFARDGGISPAQKLLVLLPAALFVQGTGTLPVCGQLLAF